MKTIKVFLASSDELKDERQKFGNLIRQLDDIFMKRGIHVQLLMWEDMDPSYNNCRKQDEYNAWIRQSQIFVALFYTRAGEYTLEELEVARTENSRRNEPKLMIYCRTLQLGEVEEEVLTDFKQRLEKQLGHFWSNYTTTDKLHLDFVMYFMRSAEGLNDALKVENGQIMLDGYTVASMDNLPFAAGNADYRRMKERLEQLPKEIEQMRLAVEQAPAVEMIKDLLQQKFDEYNQLKKDFEAQQQALFDTAKRVSEMQLEKVNSELRCAIDEFECGHIEAANAILDSIEREADRHIAQLDRDRMLVHQDIEAFQLQAKTVMADVSIPIDERIQRVDAIYAKADDWADRSVLQDKKHESLLNDYEHFLRDYAFYDKAMAVNLRLLSLRKSFLGLEHPNVAWSYINIGAVYYHQGNDSKAKDYYFKALDIFKQKLGTEHPSTATAYNNIGITYEDLDDYPKALEYHFIALTIRQKKLGEEHSATATSYNNIGMVYLNQEEYTKALEYLLKALAIRQKVLGTEHPLVANSYNNIGGAYNEQKNYRQALKYYFKALAIQEKTLGSEQLDVARSFSNIGETYFSQGDYSNAILFYLKLLPIRKKTLGAEHPIVATLLNDIGVAYDNLDNYTKALEYYTQALIIREKVLGEDNPAVATSLSYIGNIYYCLENYVKAVEYQNKPLTIRKKVLGEMHLDTATSYNNAGIAYINLGDHTKALRFLFKALAIREKKLDANHHDIIQTYSNIAAAYSCKGDLVLAEHYNKLSRGGET